MKGENSRDLGSKRSPEEEWLQKAKEGLGKDFVNKVLSFENMSPEDFKVFNEKLKNFVLKRKEINPTRIRKVYEIIRASEDLSSLLLALPKLAYMVGKEENEKRRKDLGVLYQVFSESIKEAKNEQDLQGIRKFAEALVAYHKFYCSNR